MNGVVYSLRTPAGAVLYYGCDASARRAAVHVTRVNASLAAPIPHHRAALYGRLAREWGRPVTAADIYHVEAHADTMAKARAEEYRLIVAGVAAGLELYNKQHVPKDRWIRPAIERTSPPSTIPPAEAAQLARDQRIAVIDSGCITLKGLADRADMLAGVHGPGKVFNHVRGLVYESAEGYRVLVTLSELS